MVNRGIDIGQHDIGTLFGEGLADRTDRRSAYEAFDRDLDGAIGRELELGMQALGDAAMLEGTQRFRDGAGRGGALEP